jgi:hypothetical protein
VWAIGLVILLFGLFTTLAVWQEWYWRSWTARAWFETFGRRKAQGVLTAIGIEFAVLGLLILGRLITR